MDQDEELHDKLMVLFREYFKQNQYWLSRGTYRHAVIVRNLLNDIRKTCSARRKVIWDWQVDWQATKHQKRIEQAQQKELRNQIRQAKKARTDKQ